MKLVLILFGYLNWHYSKAVYSLSLIWKDLSYFLFNFFSIKLIIMNFFSPWKRMTDNYSDSFDIKKYLESVLVNLIMRFLGMIMRTFILTFGIIICILFISLYPLIIIIWLILPLLLIFLIILGLFLLMK